MDDDDEFLYGGSQEQDSQNSNVSQPTIDIPATNGTVQHLEQIADEDDLPGLGAQPVLETATNHVDEEDEDNGSAVELGDESDEEDDIEIIMEAPTRSIDFRNQNAPRPSANRTVSAQTTPAKPQPSLTTEYTPMQRGGSTASVLTPHPSQTQIIAPEVTSTPVPAPALSSESISHPPPVAQTRQPSPAQDGGVDPSTLPAVTAPSSHPVIDMNVDGTMDGRSILDVDLVAMTEKPWRRPGSDIADYFNYGFDEISWEAYCYRRRDVGDLANVLKTNVLNFSGMPEDQVLALPAEARQMVMTGTSVMMNGGANPAMMAPGVMMDMGMMPMGMGMDMSGQMMPMAMTDGGQGQASLASSAIEPGMIPDGYNGMVMGGDYSMQTEQPQMNQQMYTGIDASASVAPVQSVRGTAAPSYPRGGRGQVSGPRGGRGFSGRGRGRGGYDTGPAAPPRPASPLPPGVPTGPRNQNKYKDRDGNAPAVDGLDYGGDRGHRTPSGEPEDRGSNRKRRSSPGLEDTRSSKRR